MNIRISFNKAYIIKSYNVDNLNTYQSGLGRISKLEDDKQRPPVTWFNPLEAAVIRTASVRRSARSETEPKYTTTKTSEDNAPSGKGKAGKE